MFLARYCLPSIRANDPAEIIVEPDVDQNGNRTRNRGAKRATQDLIAFIDDDVVLAVDFLSSLYEALKAHPEAGYAYCDSVELAFPGAPPAFAGGSRVNRPGDFSPERLCKSNYISTMSLIRRRVFSGFDAEIRRLQDWDLWLTLLAKNVVGVYVPQCLFWNCHIDAGVTVREAKEFWVEKLSLKHAPTMKRFL